MWRSEFRSVLALYIWKGYLGLREAKLLSEKDEQLMSGSEYQVQSPGVLELVKESHCSAYDCEFAALIKDLGVPLVTNGKKLIQAFPNIV